MKANRKGLAQVGECSNHFMEMSQMYRAQSLNGFSNHPVRETVPAGTKLPRRWAGLLLLLVLAFSAISPAAASSPGSEGIKVHGDWTITIRNPDGSLDREVRFTNALVDADGFLGSLVAGLITVTDLEIQIGATGVSCSLFPVLPVASAEKVSGANAAAVTWNYVFGNECVSGDSWTLTEVRTFMQTQAVGGGLNLEGVFTQKTLDTPISGILPDQQVTVKVVISFS